MTDTLHSGEAAGDADAATGEAFEISPQQKAYFDAFGFLRLPGLFKDDIDRLVAGFEEIFADEAQVRTETHEELHLERPRIIITDFIDKSDKLRPLLDDPRVVGVVRGLIGDNYEYCNSDGNLFYCESSWHPDTYGAPLTRYHVKLSFYLDPLHSDSGAIRMIPGTNHNQTPFARQIRRNLEDPQKIKSIYGVEPNQIPSWTLGSEPGDLIVWNFRTVHASYNGRERRRLFSVNFREVEVAGGEGDPS
jgi:ectoine hydroxylase-related dioxygenase (phytanoyl-CoA dioxygenase family)